MKKWSIEENEILINMLKMGFTYNEISIKLNRTNKSISRYAPL